MTARPAQQPQPHQADPFAPLVMALARLAARRQRAGLPPPGITRGATGTKA